MYLYRFGIMFCFVGAFHIYAPGKKDKHPVIICTSSEQLFVCYLTETYR